MRLTVELDGRPTVVEVADDLATVRVGSSSYPVRVVSRSPLRVELEIGGETVAVAGWPEHFPGPPGPVDVNGERWRVAVRAEAGTVAASPSIVPSPPEGRAPLAPGTPDAVPNGAVPIVPPMPGRVVELKVREGEAVARGTVLVVLEAMKMRNEIPSPIDGTVQGIRVRAGANARAKEPMLFVTPD